MPTQKSSTATNARSADEIDALIESLRQTAPTERHGAHWRLTETGVSEAFIPSLTKALTDADAFVRASAAHALGRYPLGALRKVRNRVIKALHGDADAVVRAAAAESLAACAGQVSDELLTALRDPSADVRIKALESAAMADKPEVWAAIKKCLRKDSASDVRSFAAALLGETKDKSVLGVLLKAVQDPHEDVRSSAVEAARDCARALPPAALRAIIAATSDPSVQVRLQACRSLRFSHADAIPALIVALADETPDVRSAALLSLGSLQALEAVDPIATMLRSDPDESVRRGAASALAHLRDDPRVVGLLADACQNEAEQVAVLSDIIDALGDTHEPAAMAPLCLALRSPHTDIRISAARSLSSVITFSRADPSMALASLRDAASDSEPAVRREVFDAMRGHAGAEVLPVLLQAITDSDDDLRTNAYLALSGIDAQGVEEVLLHGLSDGHWAVRRAAAEALSKLDAVKDWRAVLKAFRSHASDFVLAGHLAPVLAGTGTVTAMKALIHTLGSEEPLVRSAICVALQDDPDRLAVEPLIALLQDDHGDVRSQAALALAACEDERAFEPLQRQLRCEPEPAVRRRLVWALSFFPADQSMPWLVKGLNDPSEHVRAQAVRALSEMCDGSTLRSLLKRLPRKSTSDVRDALTEAIAEWNEGDAIPQAWERSIQIGTLHYE